MKLTFKKKEKLKSKKYIEKLFSEGKTITHFPLRLVYLKENHLGNKPLQIAFSVPKRKIKKAVDRNRIKRQLKEIYRLNKNDFFKKIDERYIIMILYTGSKELKTHQLKTSVMGIFDKFLKLNT